MNEESVVIPYTEAGKRCFEALAEIALNQLHKARGAAEDFIKSIYPTAEFIDEKAVADGKYAAIYAIPGGGRQKVLYDWKTKNVEIV
ncbi:MAG: hypothetical protein LBS32_07650 [Clostridiales Family XIII bacterium]|jgi:hypothetical protein|nr:hypothetical protein [Clostridiales Family XIII bacterium]